MKADRFPRPGGWLRAALPLRFALRVLIAILAAVPPATPFASSPVHAAHPYLNDLALIELYDITDGRHAMIPLSPTYDPASFLYNAGTVPYTTTSAEVTMTWISSIHTARWFRVNDDAPSTFIWGGGPVSTIPVELSAGMNTIRFGYRTLTEAYSGDADA